MKLKIAWPHDCCCLEPCSYQQRNAAGIVCCTSPSTCDWINEAVLNEDGVSRNKLSEDA